MLAYYSSIIPNSFRCLLFSKLCQHNWSRPTQWPLHVCGCEVWAGRDVQDSSCKEVAQSRLAQECDPLISSSWQDHYSGQCTSQLKLRW